uniref:Uncharacterized protein n=1 Tax=Romanomermis culicivorax TaxID=13658 RepID=A0A915JVS2_ROMCU
MDSPSQSPDNDSPKPTTWKKKRSQSARTLAANRARQRFFIYLKLVVGSILGSIHPPERSAQAPLISPPPRAPIAKISTKITIRLLLMETRQY